MRTDIGLNVIDANRQAAPGIQPVMTSVAGFVIRAQRGAPVEAVYRVTSWEAFVAHFGGCTDDAYGAYTVRGFFENGGAVAYVTRIVNAKQHARLTSSPAPWKLAPGGALCFEVDGSPLGKSARFEAHPAQLKAIAPMHEGSYYMAQSDGEGHALKLKVNGIAYHGWAGYRFQRKDFPQWRLATPKQITTPLNRDFTGITAHLDEHDGRLYIQTIDRGRGASLETDASLEKNSPEVFWFKFTEVLPSEGLDQKTPEERLEWFKETFKTKFKDKPGEIPLGDSTNITKKGNDWYIDDASNQRKYKAQPKGNELTVTRIMYTLLFEKSSHPKDAQERAALGNVDNIEGVTAQEAALVIAAALPAGFDVSVDDQHIQIKHALPGPQHSIRLVAPEVEADQAVQAAFNFAYRPGIPLGLADYTFDATLHVAAGFQGQPDAGAWGNEIAVKIEPNGATPGAYNLLVRYGGKMVERWEKLSHQPQNHQPEGPYHPDLLINDQENGSRYIVVEALGDENPAPTQDESGRPLFVSLADGLDELWDEAQFTAEDIKAVLHRFDSYPIDLLCWPESTNVNVVQAALDYCEQRGDCFFVGHTPQADDAQAAQAYSGQMTSHRGYGALYFPWLLVKDGNDTTKWVPPTGHVLGIYAHTARERGIWKAPAGSTLPVQGVLALQHHLRDWEHSKLVVEGRINAVRGLPGQGIFIDSARTLSRSGPTGESEPWRYVNVRLLFNFVKRALMDGLRWVIQEPNAPTLWNKVKHNVVTPFLMDLWRRGAFGPGSPAEAFAVKVDGENNPPAGIQQGSLHIGITFFPSRPAETVTIVVGQQEGGPTANESIFR